MKNVDTFLTPRMDANRITEDDFADLLRMNQNATVMATLGGIKTEAQTREFLRSGIEHWERHGYGIWIFRTRDQGRFVGRAGLRNVTIENSAEVELLYALMPEFWRQGFATEMSRAILETAAALGIADIVAFTMPTNVGSRGVMEKVGFTYERDFIWANLPHVRYRLSRPTASP
ncbi:MAG TPA: GNAT family N-acetyltransferase [Candidatus Binataceae bacterium]|nr:GNAT family N-acetyltransferase [Candidatus Binataceae bacterium]